MIPHPGPSPAKLERGVIEQLVTTFANTHIAEKLS
jgi:hypothetical protein